MDRDEAFTELTAACPSFRASGGPPGYTASFEDEQTPDVYVRTAALAHHVVAGLRVGEAEEAAWLSSAVERVLAEGDADARELVTLGLLEPMRNIVSHADVGLRADDVAALLGPAGLGAWRESEDLWEAAAARSDRPRLSVAEYDAVGDPQLRRHLQAHKRRMADGTLVGSADVVRYEEARAGGGDASPGGKPGSGVPWALLVAVLAVLGLVAVAVWR